MTPDLAKKYGCRFQTGHQIDYSKYMFAPIEVPITFKGKLNSEQEREDIIRYLVERNIPRLHTFLYYSILCHDVPVTEYLMSHRVNVLPAPYADIVMGNISNEQMSKAALTKYVDEFRQILRHASDAEMAWSISQFAECTGGENSCLSLRRSELCKGMQRGFV